MNTNDLLEKDILEIPWVAVDLETSGAYPIGDDICEIAIVRYEAGKVVDRFQTLLKPFRLVPDNIIKIHGITNEMLESSPKFSELGVEIRKRLEGAIFLAHHAPFDMGFLVRSLEENTLPLPSTPALCTSLLSRKIFPKSQNHRLQTLVSYLNLSKGTAHRALDDAEACLNLFVKCVEKVETRSLESLMKLQAKELVWDRYSISDLRDKPDISKLIDAIEAGRELVMEYRKEKTFSTERRIRPLGIVRNPDGDFLYAFCYNDNKNKRFYLSKILGIKESSSSE